MMKIITVMNNKAVVIMIMLTGGGDTIVPNDEVAWLIFLSIQEVLDANLGKISGYRD
jgi:hypothetical protein